MNGTRRITFNKGRYERVESGWYDWDHNRTIYHSNQPTFEAGLKMDEGREEQQPTESTTQQAPRPGGEKKATKPVTFQKGRYVRIRAGWYDSHNDRVIERSEQPDFELSLKMDEPREEQGATAKQPEREVVRRRKPAADPVE
jgi:hypothetical protein